MKKINKTSWIIPAATVLIMSCHSVHAAWRAGLKAGYVDAAWDTNSYPSVVEGQLGPLAGTTTDVSVWPEYRMWIYTGQVYLNGGTYHFAESINNRTWMTIDGTNCLYDIVYDVPTKSGDINLPAGWHDVEIRFGNDGGVGGPHVVSGWTLTKGFGYNINGANTTSGSDYTFPEDDGSMTLFRWIDDFDGVVNDPASDVTSSGATLNGQLLTTNLINAVSVFWGPTDGGSSVAAWSNRYDFSYPAVQGSYPTNITIDTSDSLTFYRYYMSNNIHTAWAESTESVLSGEVTVQAVDDEATEGGAGATGTFRFSRPETATNGSLTIYFTISGTAVEGVDYLEVGSSVIIPEGDSSVDVVVYPVEDLDWNEGDETVILTMQDGGYIIGTALPVSITLHDNGSPALWAHSIPIIFTGHRDSSLTDFPALVEVGTNVNGFSYSDMLSGDYDDLRFTDGSTTNFLHYEVDSWDTNGLSQVWVKLPVLAHDTTIRMYWGRAGLTSPSYTTNGATWVNNYVAVYHMAEDSGPVKDSSPYANGASVYGGIQQGTSGKAGLSARWPDGSNDWMASPSSDSLHGMDKLTLQTWFFDEKNDTNARGLISKRYGNSTGNDRKDYYFFKYQNRRIYFYTKDGAGGDFPYTETGANQWYFAAGTFDSTLSSGHMKVYINGDFKSSKDNTTGRIPTYDSDLHLGILNANYGNCWMGKMDEVRISRDARSAEWLKAEYLNMASNNVFQAWPGPDPSLVVDSDPLRGTPDPAYGTTNLTGGAIVSCTVEPYIDISEGVRYACAGFEIYTNLVELVTTGTGNSCTYTNSGGADRLVWLWKTQYYVTFTNSGPGAVSPPEGWYDDGTVVTFTASGTGGGQFTGWQGDLDNIPTQQAFDSIDVDIHEPVSLTAMYIPPFSSSGWGRRMSIDFDGYDHSEALTNFPVMVKFTDGLANFFYYSDVSSQEDAGDLRFVAADDTTELFYDIEKWDITGESVIWVRLPEFSATNNRIYAYWKNPSETTPPLYTSNGKTWDNGFVAVYHLAESGVPLKDSSPFGNELGMSGDVQLGTNGIAGPASRWPSGTGNDWLYCYATDSLHGMGQLTLQTWFYDEMNDTSPRGLISKRTSSDNTSGEKSFYFFKQLSRNLFFYVGNTGGQFSNTTTTSNQWYFASATYDKNLSSNRMKMYLDGTYRSSLAGPTTDVPVYSSYLRIGILNANYTTSNPTTPCCWQGKLDELRISAAARSADWIWAEYNNVKNHDTFQSYHQLSGGTIILVR